MSYRTPAALATASLIAGAGAAQSPTAIAPSDAVTLWRIDAAHSAVGFAVRHMGISTVRGRFAAYEGVIETGEGMAPRRIEVTIDPASIATGVERRDGHLRSADFFDVAAHPTVRFVSTRVTAEGPKRFRVLGDLTMRGVTRPVTLAVETLGDAVRDMDGRRRTGATAVATINRKDWGLNWNQALELGGVMVGEDVTLTIEIEAIAQESAAAAAATN
jgi:polyisoprenoid-binding protein YceI